MNVAGLPKRAIFMVMPGLTLGGKCVRKSAHRTIYTNYNLNLTTAATQQSINPASHPSVATLARVCPRANFLHPENWLKYDFHHTAAAVGEPCQRINQLCNYETSLLLVLHSMYCNLSIWCFQNIIIPDLECLYLQFVVLLHWHKKFNKTQVRQGLYNSNFL